MTHLSDDTLIELLGGSGASEDLEHLERCDRCRASLASWRGLVGDLGLLAESSVTEAELHRLEALYRVHGPVRQGLVEWLARLVRSTARRPLAVRGGAGQVLMEHEAGPYHVVMQVKGPDAAAEIAVHGQVSGEGSGTSAGEVVLSDERGVVAAGEIDDLGEFAVTAPAAGCYRATLLLPEARVVIEALELGAEGDG